ncbi:MAG: DUF3372 domain-containing protein [Rhizobacter sp.]|nr:DUF3372 domain-containing protein [Rhizobacter sp.]
MNVMNMRALRRAAAALAAMATVALAACGSGGGEGSSDAPAGVAAGTMRVHYQRSDGNYGNWAVYAWNGPTQPSSGWPGTPRFVFDKTDAFGVYVDITLDTSKSTLDFLLNKGTTGADTVKDGDCDRRAVIAADIATRGQQIWLKSGDCSTYASAAAASGLNLGVARALWLSRQTMVWPGSAADGQFRLHYAAQGGIEVDPSTGVSGADGALDLSVTTLSAGLATRFRQVAGALALALPPSADVRGLLKGQLVVVRWVDGKPASATQVQTQGVLDDVYAAQASGQALGVSFAPDGSPSFRLWAPTATAVSLKLLGGATLPMQQDPASGVWSVTGDKALTNSAYYTYLVTVFSRVDGAVLTREVTDPYATSLNANGEAAMAADLASAALKPAGWATQTLPPLAAPEDSVLYELHVRDFSANDASVSGAHRGKYKAFTESASHGMTHLRALAAAGLTHVHLLPVFDIASVDEAGCSTPAIVSAGATSQAPQAAATAAADTDCFNWGYDPRHFGAPEGSYASDAHDGRVRVTEFREMVAALHGAGLRVVMDVVYNHTSGNFLDQIVPGYYYRLNGDGVIETSTCCQNTAPEFAMMEKLMIDTLKTWAVQYQVDGFRFDIMGHIPKAAMLKAQSEVDAAAGRPLVYYGEAWNFGEVADDRLFEQARQANLAGTGIGSFNDRLRDAIRGGGPFDSGQDMLRNQGFTSGLCYDVNEANGGGTCSDAQRADLRNRQNLVRLGMAGSLRNFVLDGRAASAYDYGGQPAGYTDDPQEVINYAGVHDGETLYDIAQYKHPVTTSSADRARSQVVSLATVLLAQGIPFIHAGDELLRSKAFDRDSYNSGDWFNRIDWTGSTNYLAEFGLPPAAKNQDGWPLMSPLLSNAAVAPSPADIAATDAAVLDFLRLRRDTTMLRLRTGAEVMRCVSFPDEAAQQDGLVVMKVGVGDSSCGDGKYKSLVVLINANKVAQTFTSAALAGAGYALHPVQAAGADAVVKTATYDSASGGFGVPARTVAVFVSP